MNVPSECVTVSGVPAADGRPVYLVGDEAQARRMASQGKIAIGPELWRALDAVNTVFPGSRVEEIRR